MWSLWYAIISTQVKNYIFVVIPMLSVDNIIKNRYSFYIAMWCFVVSGNYLEAVPGINT